MHDLEEYGLVESARGRRRQALSRARRRRRRRLRAPRPLRRRAAEPRHLPALGRQRGRPARADRGARAALAEPREAPRGPREPRDARRALAGALEPPLLARAPRYRPAVVTVDLAAKIRDIPDFPKRGIVFKDIMPLLADPEALHETVERLAEFAEPRKPDVVLGAEARGFILGAALAYRLGCGFVAARKPGKLPWRTISAKYALEYGFDALELHADAIANGARVLDPRRPARDGRHGQGEDRPRRAARRHRRRPRVRDRAGVPERPREARRLRRLLADPVRGVADDGAENRPPCRYIIRSPMYDQLTGRYTFACPARGEVRVPLSRFRVLERLPGTRPVRRSSRSRSPATAAASTTGSSRTTSSTGRRSPAPTRRSSTS